MGSFIRFLLFLASRLRNAGAPNLSFNHFLKIFHQSNRNLNHRHQCFPAKNVCLIPIEPYVVCILISKIQACHPLVQPPLCLAVPYPFVKCFLCHSLTGFLVQPASFLQTFCGMSGYIHKITRFPFLLYLCANQVLMITLTLNHIKHNSALLLKMRPYNYLHFEL